MGIETDTHLSKIGNGILNWNLLSYTTSSYALTASFALNGGGSGTSLNTGSTYPITSSWANNAISASYALNASMVGTDRYIPSWISNTLTPTSSIYQKDNDHILINSTTYTNPSAPETLLVNQTSVGSFNIATFIGDANDYLQINTKNQNTGVSSSGDIVVTADNGDESIYYVDMGIGSSVYNDARWPLFKPNEGYLYVNGENLVIGTDTAGKKIKFFTDGAQNGNVRAYIDSTGLHASGSVDSASYIIPGATFNIVSGSNGYSQAFVDVYDVPSDPYYPSYKEGRMWYDGQYHNMDYYTEDPGFRCQLGKELIVGVHNPYAVTLPRLSVVYVSGSTGNHPDVYLAIADGTGTKSKITGVIRSNIASGSNGYMLTRGIMHRSNMTGYKIGDSLWLSPDTQGAMTLTRPGQPSEEILVGYCTEEGVSGSFVCNIREYPVPANSYAGITSTTLLDNPNDGTIVVSTGSVNLFDDANGAGAVKGYSLASTTLNLITGSTNYIIVEHSGSGAKYGLTTDSTYANGISIVRVFTLDINYKGPGNWDVHEFNVGIVGLALANRLNNKDIKLRGYEREFGLILAQSASRNVIITEGNVWYGPNSHLVPAFDSTTGEMYAFYHSASGWLQPSSSVYENCYYDNGTNRVPLTDGFFTVNFVYRLIGTTDEAAFVLSNNEYSTSVDAQNNAQPTSNLPSTITDIGLLVGRIIVESGSNTAAIVESAFATAFAAATITNHESLLGLQGGTGGQHYHLTAADNTGIGTGLMVRAAGATLTSVTLSGSLLGTSSWSSNAVNALSANTASYVITSSYSLIATSASYAPTVSASYALTASYTLTASCALNVSTASYTPTASYSITSSYIVSSSYAVSSSYVPTVVSSSYALAATSASYAITASYVPTNITYASASLQTTVTMSAANIWYDGPSITLDTGTWLVEACGQFRRLSNGSTNTQFRINNGNTVYVQAHHWQGSTNPNAYAMKVGTIINLVATQTAITASALVDSATQYFSNRTGLQSSGSNATQIYAIKII